MTNQIYMYQVFYYNSQYVNFINTTHFKKAVPCETVLKVLYDNKVYANFIFKNNTPLKKKDILKNLNMFKDKFWLKQKAYAVTLLLKHIKTNKININNINMFFVESDLNEAITQFLNNLFLKTKVKQNKLIKIYNIAKLSNADALDLILKYKLVK